MLGREEKRWREAHLAQPSRSFSLPNVGEGYPHSCGQHPTSLGEPASIGKGLHKFPFRGSPWASNGEGPTFPHSILHLTAMRELWKAKAKSIHSVAHTHCPSYESPLLGVEDL